jgi:hypothetical protein
MMGVPVGIAEKDERRKKPNHVNAQWRITDVVVSPMLQHRYGCFLSFLYWQNETSRNTILMQERAKVQCIDEESLQLSSAPTPQIVKHDRTLGFFELSFQVAHQIR